jgi:hypothetical protein
MSDASAGVGSPAREERAAREPERPREGGVASPAPSEPASSLLRIGAGAQLDAIGVAAPGARLAPRFFVELLIERAALLAPALRLSAARYTSPELSIPGASASFIWSVARLDACPLAFRLPRGVALRPCAAIEAGTLHAEGVGGIATQSRLRPWAGVSVLARAEWRVAGPLLLGGELGVLAPLLREDFFFSPDALPGGTVYTAPALALEGGLGLGVRFP